MAIISTKWIDKEHCIELHNSVCTSCKGEGKFTLFKGSQEIPCTACNGYGIVRVEKEIKLTIKPLKQANNG